MINFILSEKFFCYKIILSSEIMKSNRDEISSAMKIFFNKKKLSLFIADEFWDKFGSF